MNKKIIWSNRLEVASHSWRPRCSNIQEIMSNLPKVNFWQEITILDCRLTSSKQTLQRVRDRWCKILVSRVNMRQLRLTKTCCNNPCLSKIKIRVRMSDPQILTDWDAAWAPVLGLMDLLTKESGSITSDMATASTLVTFTSMWDNGKVVWDTEEADWSGRTLMDQINHQFSVLLRMISLTDSSLMAEELLWWNKEWQSNWLVMNSLANKHHMYCVKYLPW